MQLAVERQCPLAVAGLRLFDADLGTSTGSPGPTDSERPGPQIDIRPAQAEHLTAAQAIERQAQHAAHGRSDDALARNFLTSALLQGLALPRGVLGRFGKPRHVADELALQDGRLQRCAESSQRQPCAHP